MEMKKEMRLIDANALKKCTCEWCNTHYSDEPCEPSECIEMLRIDAQPTVDAVEVVHGEWEIIEDDYFDLVEMKCSVCGESYGFEDYEDDTPQNYHYCPNCGADMRERKNEERNEERNSVD